MLDSDFLKIFSDTLTSGRAERFSVEPSSGHVNAWHSWFTMHPLFWPLKAR